MEQPNSTVMIVSPSSPGTFLTRGYYGKKGKSKKKGKKENTEWDSGFGELYEKIEERKPTFNYKSVESMLK
jgi:hypothetical protein